MKFIDRIFTISCMIGATLTLQSCTGIFDSVYDSPDDSAPKARLGELYINASEWDKWHYIDLPKAAALSSEDEEFDANSLWQSYPVPMEEVEHNEAHGIYTYWYDVFGAGIKVNEFRSFYPAGRQEEPEEWTIGIHRNNVRTNGCAAAATSYTDMSQLPDDKSFIKDLTFEEDRWNETDVWCEQSSMLLGLIGNQGITVNHTLSSWLSVDIPPIPPSFTLNNKIFILRLPDDSYAALQLINYQSQTGTKCCLSIKYKYPL